MAATSEYTVRLSSEERERLSTFDHALDYEFSDEELDFLETNGYLVLRGIIEPEVCDMMASEAVTQIGKTGISLSDQSTWGSIPYHGCFSIWHTPTYNQLRQNPLLYSVFAQVLKTGNLTVSVDRLNLKAPCRTAADCRKQMEANDTLELHSDLNYWHSDPNVPIYQGGLCLHDCPAGGGGFFCLPGFHRPERVRQYVADANRGRFGHPNKVIPKESKAFNPFLDKMLANDQKVEVPLNKGDFVIWNNNLPHAGGKNSLMVPPNREPNSLDNFRIHCFIMFVPLDGPCVSEKVAEFYRQYQAETRHSVFTGEPPVHFATRNRTPTSGGKRTSKAAYGEITPLGQKIFGLVPYHSPNTEE